ncbi:Grx4 family monothiol glutaredoxin [Xanthomonas translucens pv. undulosa]|uniref:Grx4 family monothiol glutaredoxin n=1 Tax=Xanthomonas campestris pv. translucens TaxID=343 RepID=UPI000642346A|nr:Grx4 family monothiol glutaredoxin [Xanthomonas translucens]AKK68790.1 glutaredoxin [Xanthomonas translucens pv. undulosa]AVY65702.1 glutaredoxin [Xanthomonas translucens pv. undulosa]MCT8269819.1 Grx4 family monothiol glutaredoxin [Xanthomonas translucens pv. undulosa]QSQ42753.1 Grx4 family monothiol glutaredoxin [Xanthomonas translucens pv. translucens]QSQ49398.1 Grx4 family monothiol glutaredoxin [Xanthomonas translucens pv. undulosa]
MSLDPALRSRIETLLSSNRVVLFMKGQPSMPQCGFSAKAVGALNELGVDFAHVNVLADQDIREGIKAYGDWPTIPQLYVDGELVGGSDIILQMAGSGELSELLGVQAPDRTPPSITITDAAADMLRGALADAPGATLALAIDAQFQPNFQLAPTDPNAIAAESNGLRVQFDLASARRAEGITIDWVDDLRGRGLAIDNPNAPKPVQELSVRDADDQVRAGGLILVDVRPPEERAIASLNVPFRTLDGDQRAQLEALPKDTALAFLCHHGGRSAQAAEQFRALGFSRVHNVVGGIDAWADAVDSSVVKY